MASPSAKLIFASVAYSLLLSSSGLGALLLGTANRKPRTRAEYCGEAETYVVRHPVLDPEKAPNYSSPIAKSAISWKSSFRLRFSTQGPCHIGRCVIRILILWIEVALVTVIMVPALSWSCQRVSICGMCSQSYLFTAVSVVLLEFRTREVCQQQKP
jgi:hypothetical protein